MWGGVSESCSSLTLRSSAVPTDRPGELIARPESVGRNTPLSGADNGVLRPIDAQRGAGTASRRKSLTQRALRLGVRFCVW